MILSCPKTNTITPQKTVDKQVSAVFLIVYGNNLLVSYGYLTGILRVSYEYLTDTLR